MIICITVSSRFRAVCHIRRLRLEVVLLFGCDAVSNGAWRVALSSGARHANRMAAVPPAGLPARPRVCECPVTPIRG